MSLQCHFLKIALCVRLLGDFFHLLSDVSQSINEQQVREIKVLLRDLNIYVANVTRLYGVSQVILLRMWASSLQGYESE